MIQRLYDRMMTHLTNTYYRIEFWVMDRLGM